MHKYLRLISAGYFVILAAIIAGIWLAAPSDDSKEILGMVVRSSVDNSEDLFISNRWIGCQPAHWDDEAESACTIDLFGKMLEIVAARNPLSSPVQLEGNCTASYDDKQKTCTIGSYGGNIRWVANVYLGGITEAQHNALRRRHILGNLPKAYYFFGTLVASALTMLMVSTTKYFSMRKNLISRPNPSQKRSLMVSATVVGLVAGVLSLIICMVVIQPFW